MPVYYFDHVHLNSLNPTKTAEFYEKYFGAKFISTNNMGSGRTTVKLSLNGTIILISTPRGDSSQIGLDHFGKLTLNDKYMRERDDSTVSNVRLFNSP